MSCTHNDRKCCKWCIYLFVYTPHRTIKINSEKKDSGTTIDLSLVYICLGVSISFCRLPIMGEFVLSLARQIRNTLKKLLRLNKCRSFGIFHSCMYNHFLCMALIFLLYFSFVSRSLSLTRLLYCHSMWLHLVWIWLCLFILFLLATEGKWNKVAARQFVTLRMFFMFGE